MELGLRLAQKQTQKLVMTPRLQQALKLLQMPSLELSQHIEQELLSNPLLELEEEASESNTSTTEETEERTSPDETELQSGAEEEINWGDYLDDGFEYTDGVRTEHEEKDFYERVPVGHATLTDNLTEQLHLSDLDEETTRIAEYILGCLDDRGFLVVPIEEVAAELAISLEAAEEALARVQRLEPPGIGARDLPECLLIQLRAQALEDSLAADIVRDHFEAFKQKQYQDIARALKVKPADIQDAATDIAALNPRPGAELALDDAQYVVPDLVVEKVDGRYVVSLSEGTVPRLRVSRKYREILQRDAQTKEAEGPSSNGTKASAEAPSPNGHAPESADAANPTPEAPASAESKGEDGKESETDEVKFVQDKLKSANWLIQTIEQRRRTMIRVMESIVEAQGEFFERGPQALKPLTLQDVAEKIGMHESTVSRVTTNKYVQTPRGVFPLKFFFSSGLDTDSGEAVSSKMAMERIKDLIDREEKKKPLSDQKLAELLRKEGLKVARRTVAKYREKLGILSARYRKVF